MLIASSRSLALIRKNPPSCSRVSANGPSVTSRLPSRTRTLVAVATGCNGAAARYCPVHLISRASCTDSSRHCSFSASSEACSSPYTSSIYFIWSPPFWPELAPGHGPYDEKGLRPHRDRVGQRGIRQLVGQIPLAGEEPQERPALLRDVVADRPAQHRITGLQRVDDRALRHRTFNLELHLSVDPRQPPQMCRQHDPYHGSVWTSTDTTAGRSRTMGRHRSPAS